jgi:hypothetical protein
METVFTETEMKEQVLAIVCNHKRVTVQAVASITNFDGDFIEKTLDEFVSKGSLKSSNSFISDGDRISIKCWRVRKKYLAQSLFGEIEQD